MFEKLKAYFHKDAGQNLNQFMKRKQNVIGIILLFIIILSTVILHVLSENKKVIQKPIDLRKQAKLDGVLSSDFTAKDEISELEKEQQQVDSLKNQLALMQKKNNNQSTDAKSQHDDILMQVKKIVDKRMSAKKPAVVPKPSALPFSSVSQMPVKNGLQTIRFQYPVHQIGGYHKAHVSGHSPKNYVPAGTFVKAVLLEGADTNASVNAQSDTTPILVRLLNQGMLPNGHHSHLRGCFVLASMYGDISSERGEVRLDKISCTEPDGHILEKKVQGYISFAGKEGIKGIPVMRNGKILEMAGISGMLSGFGSAIQQSTQTQSVSPLGATTSVNPNKVWQNGAFGGASNAMSQLAKYYIKRADQYHPVIEIGSGTVATVIFQDGFSLNQDDKAKPQLIEHKTPEISQLLKQAQHLGNFPFSSVH